MSTFDKKLMQLNWFLLKAAGMTGVVAMTGLGLKLGGML